MNRKMGMDSAEGAEVMTEPTKAIEAARTAFLAEQRRWQVLQREGHWIAARAERYAFAETVCNTNDAARAVKDNACWERALAAAEAAEGERTWVTEICQNAKCPRGGQRVEVRQATESEVMRHQSAHRVSLPGPDDKTTPQPSTVANDAAGALNLLRVSPARTDDCRNESQ